MALDLSIKGFENGIRLLVPMALLAILFLLSVTSMSIPYAGSVRPALVLIAVYYWSIFRPTLMPPFLCFLVGLLLDIISGLPLGIHAIIFTLVQWTVRDQRKFLMAQAYMTTWAVFILVALGATFLQWGLYGLVRLQWSPVMPVLVSVGVTILLFPVVTFFLILSHRILPTSQKPC